MISPKAFPDFQGFRAYSLLSFNDLRDKVPSCLPDHDPSHFDAIFKYYNHRDDLGALRYLYVNVCIRSTPCHISFPLYFVPHKENIILDGKRFMSFSVMNSISQK